MSLIQGERIDTSTDNFGNLRRKNCLLVDKTLLIKEFYCDAEISIITRPRRSGKTLNLSMIQHFFAAEVNNLPTAHLFENTLIAKEDNGQFLAEHQGKYPVIFITLKDLKESSGEETAEKLKILVQQLYQEHEKCLLSDKINDDKKNIFRKYLTTSIDRFELENSIRFLSDFLYAVYGKKVIILIDEYDSPMNHAYMYDFLEPVARLMRNVLSAAFKTTTSLEKGLITGILRISRDEMLSGLNNPKIYTILDDRFSQYFGFTESEVQELMTERQVKEVSLEAVKQFYNGYLIGNTIIYNPWSTMNFFDNKELAPYWVFTSNDYMIKNMLIKSSDETKQEVMSLMQGNTISYPLDLALRYEDLMEKPDALWTLLLFCGYLTVESKVNELTYYRCQLRIPNREILCQYQNTFIEPLREKLHGFRRYDTFLHSLLSGQVDDFIAIMGDYLMESLSFHNVNAKTKSERFYHGFVLGLIASVRDTHRVISNRESGHGLYDVMLIPKNTSNISLGIILEFKHVQKHKLLEAEANQALDQINAKQYDTEFDQQPHITHVLKMGLAFCEKSVCAVYWTKNQVNNTYTVFFR